MDLTHCPSCDTFSPAGSTVCQQCHQPIPEIPESPPARQDEPAAEAPASAPPSPAEAAPIGTPALPAIASTAEAAPAETPARPPFEASPEIIARAEALQKSIAANPAAKALYLQLSQLYADAKRTDLAVKTLEDLLVIEPRNAYIRHRIDQLKRPPGSAAPLARPTGTTAAYARPAGRTAMYPRRAAPSGPIENLRVLVTRRPLIAIATMIVLIAAMAAAVAFFLPSTRQLVTGDFRAYDPQWSPSNKHIAFLIAKNEGVDLAVYDLRRRAHRVIGAIGGYGARPFAWSPDGRQLAYVGSPSESDWREVIRIADIESGQSRVLGPGSAPAWCVDGVNLVVACRTNATYEQGYGSDEWTPPSSGLCRVNSVTGESQRLTDLPERSYEYAPQLDKIAFAREILKEEAVAAGPSPAKEFEGFVDAVIADDPSNVAEGHRNLSREIEAREYMDKKRGRGGDPSLFNRDIFIMDVTSAEPTQITNDGNSELVSWTPDGLRILYTVSGAAGTEIWTMNPQGGDKRAVTAGPLQIESGSRVALTSDGKHVLFVAPVQANEGMAMMMTGEKPADMHILRVGDAKPKRLGNKHSFKHRYALSPDGKRIVYEVRTNIKLIGGAQGSELWMMSR